jgi:methionine sulfoxide reductase heme-binding subunit
VTKSPNREGFAVGGAQLPRYKNVVMTPRKLPWYDYAGNFSPWKTAVLAALFIPGLWTVISFAMDQLGARPLTEAIHQFGDWTIRLIFISLAITPARILLQWPRLLDVRRMIGVAAFVYILMHFLLYIGDQSFDLAEVASEIVLRIYLTIGFTALLGLAVLATTSTDDWQRKLGARRWQSLHRILYGIGVLAVIHFCLQSKLNEWEPTVMAGIFLWLMGCRLITWRYGRGRLPLWVAGVLSLASALLTALGEAFYFWIGMGAPFDLVLGANFSLETGLRPAWVVLASTGGLVLLGALRALVKPPSKARLKTA